MTDHQTTADCIGDTGAELSQIEVKGRGRWEGKEISGGAGNVVDDAWCANPERHRCSTVEVGQRVATIRNGATISTTHWGRPIERSLYVHYHSPWLT